MRLLVGSFGPDIHTVDFDPDQLTLKYISRTSVGTQAAWLVPNTDETMLYVCDECGTYEATGGPYHKDVGAIVVFRINTNNDAEPLTRLQTILSSGHSPAQMTLDEDERMLRVANYFGGTFSTFRVLSPPLGPSGLLRAEQVIDLNDPAQLELGPDERRQDVAHAHWIGNDHLSRGRFVYGIDLGQDKIFQYKVDGTRLVEAETPFVRSRAGAGPRHMVFHPEKPWCYVVNELDSTLSFHEQDLQTGCLSAELQYMSTIPADTKAYSRASAIILDAESRFIYLSNRGGSDSIGVYKILENGRFEHVQTIDSRGSFPRHIGISHDGKWLMAANQKTGNVEMFARDAETGILEWKVGLGGIDHPVFPLFLRD
jgi:6-phosphogluconolactonase